MLKNNFKKEDRNKRNLSLLLQFTFWREKKNFNEQEMKYSTRTNITLTQYKYYSIICFLKE